MTKEMTMEGNIKLRAIKSFYDNRLGLVTLEDDVLSIVSQVKELTDGRVSIQLDPVSGWYHLIEHCEDTTDRLVFTVQELDGRVVKRLMQADSRSRSHEDPYAAVEHEQDELRERQDKERLEQLMAAGEELAWSLGDGAVGYGPGYKQSISVPKEISADS